MNKCYSEMLKFQTFKDRFKYLKLDGKVGIETFGYDRYLNQILYSSKEWKRFRDQIIIRDNGCDLGIEDRIIRTKVLIHHINPITKKDILDRSPMIFDPENVICVSHRTHEAIHYSDADLLLEDYTPRRKNDTIPWR